MIDINVYARADIEAIAAEALNKGIIAVYNKDDVIDYWAAENLPYASFVPIEDTENPFDQGYDVVLSRQEYEGDEYVSVSGYSDTMKGHVIIMRKGEDALLMKINQFIREK